MSVTIAMIYFSSRVQVGTRFVDFFPSYHPYILLNGKYQRSFGGAETLAIMIHVKDGDIFNPTTLKKIQGLTAGHGWAARRQSRRSLFARIVPHQLR